MSAVGRSFDEIKGGGSPTRYCPRCDAKNAGVVTVAVRQRKGDVLRAVTSRAASFCEPCCVEVFEALVEQLQERRRRP